MGSKSGSAAPGTMRVASGGTGDRCLFLALVAGALLWMGCSPGMPELTVEEQDAKLSPIIVGSGSVFMKIINAGRGEDTLVRGQVSMPGALVELHDVDEGKMIKTDRIRIPAKSTVWLRPAGVHIMIFKMPKNINEGSEFTLTLSFEKTGDVRLPLQFTPASTHR